jgi:hypothetical protein
MQACASLKRSEVLSWLPNSRGQEQRGSKSAVVALLLTQLRPDHVVGRSLPEITKYVHRYFTDFCLHRVQDEDKNEALEAAQKVSGVLRSLAHVVPAPADDDTSTDASSSEEEEEEEEAPLVKPAGKQPHKPLTEQEQNQLKTNLVFYSTNAHFKPKIESLVRDLSPHCIDDDDDSVEFESLNIPCMRALQKLFEDERTRRTKMLKDYHRRAKAKRDSKAEAEPMQVQPTVEAKSVEPVIAPAAEPVVESKSVESKTETVVEESKAPEPMETDEKSDDEDDSLDNVPDRTLPMRPLTPETVTCEWSTDYYSPFEGGMSDEEIKTRYGVTMPPSSPTFSAMSTTSSSTPMDAMSSSSLTPTKHTLQEEEDDNASVAKRPRRFLTEVERLKSDFEQPNPTRFSKRLLRTTTK